jgi:hypothetical protein
MFSRVILEKEYQDWERDIRARWVAAHADGEGLDTYIKEVMAGLKPPVEEDADTLHNNWKQLKQLMG